MLSSPTPAFSLDRDRYDQMSYIGRVLKFVDVTNPRNLLVSDGQIAEYKANIDSFRRTGKAPAGVSDDQLWTARSTLESVIHPDSGDVIPIPFRFSAFVPINLPICVGMLTASTVPTTIFWQWINQSYNVAVNHANRNASNPMSSEQIAKAYCSAVGISCGLSVGLGQIAQRSNMPLLRQFVPFIAVASAGVFNVVLMRYNELTQGITIKDENGTEVGKSQIAGRSALAQVALTRIALPAPILIIPPLIMNALTKANKIPSGRFGRLFVETGIITACLAMAVPLAIGLFPQHGTINADEIESEFQGLRDKKGNPIRQFFYNKGL